MERMRQLVSIDIEQQMQKSFDLQLIEIVVSLELEPIHLGKQIASKNSAIWSRLHGHDSKDGESDDVNASCDMSIESG